MKKILDNYEFYGVLNSLTRLHILQESEIRFNKGIQFKGEEC